MTNRSFSMFLFVAASACQPSEPTVGSETHFLSLCSSDAACGGGLRCVCGACTLECEETSECSPRADGSVCSTPEARPLSQTCGESEISGTCERSCQGTVDCADLGENYFCDRGFCRQPLAGCDAPDYSATDIALLGDNFLANSGQVTQELEALLSASGLLTNEQSLLDYSSTSVTPFGGADDLFAQYGLAKTEGSPRLLILDAGGPDALLDCDTTGELCPTLVAAVDGTRNLLLKMQDDGVEHVVLFFYPKSDDSVLNEKFELLGPELESACSTSHPNCHFVYLAPYFTGRNAELLSTMGLFPTDAGAEVTAGALYGVMQRTCILR